MFSEQFIHQVAQATDIVDLISQYVALKKKGKEFVGLCPFHEDHRPSMYVTPVKQIFKCFSCGAGGGVFQFMTMYEKVSFPEAVRSLAERAHIPIPKESATAQDAALPAKADIVKVTTFAARFFRSQLKARAGKAALDYALKRGLTDESLERFGIGYAPESWDALLLAGRKEGFRESDLIDAGLIVRREDGSGCYDRFRNRLIFPILDATGKVIAFGGRALAADEQAKYLNSPETFLFDKSSQLYALNWAREAIVSSGQAVVVEGYMDALMPHQAGVSNVVATLGTSLTDRHARLLIRYAKEVVLVFDADAAGIKAAERALELFLAQRLHVRVATIPSGKDPCDYILAEGAEAFRKLLAEAPDALQYVWQKRQDAYKAAGGNLADRRRVVEEFLQLVASSAAYGAIDEVRRGQLAQHIGHMLNIAPEDLQAQMRRLVRQIPRVTQPAAPVRSSDGALQTISERHVLEVLVNQGDLYDYAAERIDPRDFADPALRRLAEIVWRLGGAGRLTVDEVLAVQEIADLGSLVAELAAAGEARGNYPDTLTGAVEHILYHKSRGEAAEIKSQALSDDEALRQFQRRLQSPDPRRRPKIS